MYSEYNSIKIKLIDQKIISALNKLKNMNDCMKAKLLQSEFPVILKYTKYSNQLITKLYRTAVLYHNSRSPRFDTPKATREAFAALSRDLLPNIRITMQIRKSPIRMGGSPGTFPRGSSSEITTSRSDIFRAFPRPPSPSLALTVSLVTVNRLGVPLRFQGDGTAVSVSRAKVP